MVSGCFDLLHAGHIAFFNTAAQYGRLHVYIGSDHNLKLLKGKAPCFSQEERKYMVGAIKYVEEAHIASGTGMLDFEPDMKMLKPDAFVVNSDGFTPDKKRICEENGIRLVVLERIPDEVMPVRSSFGDQTGVEIPLPGLSGRRLDGSAVGIGHSPQLGSGGTDPASHRF